MVEVAVLLYGAGGVGQALARQLLDRHDAIAARVGCPLRLVAIADSRSWLSAVDGLTGKQLQEAVASKRLRGPLSEKERLADRGILEWAESADYQALIVVDATASDNMEPLLNAALSSGHGVVLANKQPLAGPWENASRFYGSSLLRYEATVAGGQPVIATLRTLLDAGDTLLRIEGQLSGTFSYICRRLDKGKRFSVALAAARASGVTEPDPRQDLSGEDVKRKLLILGRTAGWPLEEADIEVESIVPSALDHLDVTEFMAASIALDPSIADRVNAAGAAGERLRYVAELEEKRGRVRLTPVPVESPFAALKYLSFQTRQYREPLLVASNTTGVEMTAAGVLADIVGLVRERVRPL